MIVDRAAQRPVSGGAPNMDRRGGGAHAERIQRVPVDPRYGLFPHQASALAFGLYRDLVQVRAAAAIAEQLYAAFYAVGASLAEINPLVTTPDGRVLALDAKLVVDDNALLRRPEIAALRALSAELPSERQAGPRTLVHQTERHGGLLRQRRGTRDGDYGSREVLRRRAG
jgi:succinyl-CoA synthetase beta subunit